MSEFEAAQLLRDRSCKGAALVSKQFAFYQAGGNGGAIELHKGGHGTGAQVVKGPGDELLAGTGFSLNEHGRPRGRHGLHLLQYTAKSSALPDDFVEVILGADLVFEIELLFRQVVLEHLDLLVVDGIIHRD